MDIPCSKKKDCSLTDSCVPKFCVPVSDCVLGYCTLPELSFFSVCVTWPASPGTSFLLASFGWIKRPTLIFPALWVCLSKLPCHGKLAFCIDNLRVSRDSVYDLSVSDEMSIASQLMPCAGSQTLAFLIRISDILCTSLQFPDLCSQVFYDFFVGLKLGINKFLHAEEECIHAVSCTLGFYAHNSCRDHHICDFGCWVYGSIWITGIFARCLTAFCGKCVSASAAAMIAASGSPRTSRSFAPVSPGL